MRSITVLFGIACTGTCFETIFFISKSLLSVIDTSSSQSCYKIKKIVAKKQIVRRRVLKWEGISASLMKSETSAKVRRAVWVVWVLWVVWVSWVSCAGVRRVRGYLVLLVGGRVLLVGGVVRGGGLGERGRGQRAGERGRLRAAARARAAPVHLAALRQRHVRACVHHTPLRHRSLYRYHPIPYSDTY